MAEDEKQKFSHIVVGDGGFDDDDIVIRAGAVDAAPAPEPAPAVAPAPDPAATEVEPEPAPAEPEGQHVSDSAGPDDEAEGAAGAGADRAKPSGKKKDAYHATTLEDLESTKMPTTQRIVIIAAIVLIILAIAWFLMR